MNNFEQPNSAAATFNLYSAQEILRKAKQEEAERRLQPIVNEMRAQSESLAQQVELLKKRGRAQARRTGRIKTSAKRTTKNQPQACHRICAFTCRFFNCHYNKRCVTLYMIRSKIWNLKKNALNRI